MAPSRSQPNALSTPELIVQAQDAIQALVVKPDVEAFNALLALSEVLGAAIGESARLLAAHINRIARTTLDPRTRHSQKARSTP